MYEKLERIHSANCIVGESPVWDHRSSCLYFVDIRGKCFYRTDGVGGKSEKFPLPQQAGCMALCEDGSLLFGMEDGVYFWSEGAVRPAHVPAAVKGRRFNDGKVGPDGMYYAGTTDDNGRGAFYRLNNGKLTELFGSCRCSNGLDWSADQKTLFYADSRLHKVELFDFDAKRHTLRNRRDLIPVGEGFGLPDGMAADANDNIWLAVWGGASLIHIDGRTGGILHSITLPVPQVSSCCFAGKNLDLLVITTAAFNADPAVQPMAGNTFCIRTEVPGRPFRFYRG